MTKIGAVVTTVQEYLLFAEDRELRHRPPAATCQRCPHADDLIPVGNFFLCRTCKMGGRRPAPKRISSGPRFKSAPRPRPRVGYLAL